jgi:hypothetical protein
MRAFKILAAAGMAIIAAMAFSFSSASAGDPSHTADCSFTGLAGTATPDATHAPHTAGVESFQQDASIAEHGDNVILDFDHGSYTFTGTGTCVVNEGNPGDPRVANVTIASSGTYANQICGTGTATSASGNTTVKQGTTDLVNSVAYSIDFKGGTGPLTGTANHQKDNNPVKLAGVVNITPSQGSCATGTGPTSGVTQFSVAGDFAWSEGSVGLPAAPQNTSSPTITGTARDGQALTATPGSWSGSPAPVAFLYQWVRCSPCAPITGANSQSYTLTPADVGKTIQVQVTAVGAGLGGPASSAQTPVVAAAAPVNQTPPVVVGAPVVGQQLRTTDGTWTGTTPQSYSYQWQRCSPTCSDIFGATSSTYTLTADDAGRTMRARVTASNAGGSASASSAETAPIVAPGDPSPTPCGPGQIGTPPACVDTSVDQSGTTEPSARCTAPTAEVLYGDQYAGSTLRLRVQQNGTSSAWVCLRASNGSTGFGGRLLVEPPTNGGGGLPAVDANSTACGNTPGNQAPGPHPVVGSPIAGQHALLDIWSNGTEAWVCLELGSSVKHRVVMRAPGVSGGRADFERDP